MVELLHLHIDLGHTADEQLELALIEDVDEVLWDELAEARHEGVELFLDTPGDTVFHDAVHVFLLVLFRNWDIGATSLLLDGDHLTEALFGRGEGLVNDIGDVVLPVRREQSDVSGM